jgi:hypothetical protein
MEKYQRRLSEQTDKIAEIAADAAKQIAKNHDYAKYSVNEYDWDDCEIIKYACRRAFVLGRKAMPE